MAASDPVNIECGLSAMDDTNSGILSLGFVVTFRYCATKSPCGKFLNFIMAMCYLVFGYFNTVFCWLVRLTNPIEARKSCSYEICGNMEMNKKAAIAVWADTSNLCSNLIRVVLFSCSLAYESNHTFFFKWKHAHFLLEQHETRMAFRL